jgi:hypothetical protein
MRFMRLMKLMRVMRVMRVKWVRRWKEERQVYLLPQLPPPPLSRAWVQEKN